MKVAYRLATQSDQSTLWEMLYQAIYIAPGEPPPPRDIIFRPNLACYVENWGKPDDLGVIALAPLNRPIGAAWVRLLTAASGGYGYVDDAYPELSMAVLPEFRGQGVGTALLNKLLSAARKRFLGVSLSVSAGNPARRLYERAGFMPVISGADAIIMLVKF